MMALWCAAMLALFVGGCILIPCGYECESERIVAKREGESGQTQEIVHKKDAFESVCAGSESRRWIVWHDIFPLFQIRL